MRTIDADKFKKTLLELACALNGQEACFAENMELESARETQTKKRMVEDIIDILDEQLAVDEWISCGKKLPEESNFYMGCIYSPKVDDYDFRKVWFAHVDDYDIDESEWRELYSFERVVAWRELPEPYKGNEGK